MFRTTKLLSSDCRVCFFFFFDDNGKYIFTLFYSLVIVYFIILYERSVFFVVKKKKGKKLQYSRNWFLNFDILRVPNLYLHSSGFFRRSVTNLLFSITLCKEVKIELSTAAAEGAKQRVRLYILFLLITRKPVKNPQTRWKLSQEFLQ